MSDEDNNEQFIAWWKSNWPDLAPTHQALHAWLAAREMLDERIAKAREILETAVRVNSVSIKRIQHALAALEGK